MIDPALRDRAYRHGLRQLRRLLVVCLMPAVILLVVTAGLDVTGQAAYDWPSLLLDVVGGLLAGAGVWGFGYAVFRLGHRGFPGLAPGPPLVALDRERRRRIESAVDRGEHLDGEDEELARELAASRIDGRWIAALPFPVAPILYLAYHRHHGDLSLPHAAFWTAVGLASALTIHHEARLGRRYLGSSTTAE